jgi:glucosamine-6-phosphate deaminase
MFHHFFAHVDILPANINILNGNALDLSAECEAYEAKIKAVGGIELFLGGIGADGHIAFNEPGSSLASRTRVKTLAYDTVIANSRFFDGNMDLVLKMALTVGVQTILEVCSRNVIAKHIADAAQPGSRSRSHRHGSAEGTHSAEMC